jgi:hypothetical protein
LKALGIILVSNACFSPPLPQALAFPHKLGIQLLRKTLRTLRRFSNKEGKVWRFAQKAIKHGVNANAAWSEGRCSMVLVK